MLHRTSSRSVLISNELFLPYTVIVQKVRLYGIMINKSETEI